MRVLFIFLLGGVALAKAQTPQQLDNIKAFNRLFGYVRYFHPSDEAAKLDRDWDWNRLAIYGCQQVERCKDSNELKKTLLELFLPVAPSLKIYGSNESFSFSQKEITPPDPTSFKTITWQHFGVGLGNSQSQYESARLNRKNKKKYFDENAPLFERHCKIGEHIASEIGGGLTAVVPLAVYGNDEYTFPQGDVNLLNTLRNNLDEVSGYSAEDLYLRLGDVVITWNIFQHFYPYYDVVQDSWENEFLMAIKEAYTNKTEQEFVRTLRKLTAPLKDGHLWVSSPVREDNFVFPFAWELVENRLVITEIFGTNLPLSRGDIVVQVDDVKGVDFFRQCYPYISAPTKGFLEERARFLSMHGVKNSKVVLTISNDHQKNQKVEVARSRAEGEFSTLHQSKMGGLKRISEEIFYINLAKASWKDIEGSFTESNNQKHLSAISADTQTVTTHY